MPSQLQRELSCDGLYERHSFAAPMTDAKCHYLGRQQINLGLSAGCIVWRDQCAAGNAQRSKSQCQRELRFVEMSERRADRADGDIPVCRQEGRLFSGGNRGARRCRVDRGCILGDPQRRPETSQNAFNSARGGSGGMTGVDVDEPCKRFGASALRMRSRLKHQEHATRSQSKAAAVTRPDRCEVLLKIEAAAFIE